MGSGLAFFVIFVILFFEYILVYVLADYYCRLLLFLYRRLKDATKAVCAVVAWLAFGAFLLVVPFLITYFIEVLIEAIVGSKINLTDYLSWIYGASGIIELTAVFIKLKKYASQLMEAGYWK